MLNQIYTYQTYRGELDASVKFRVVSWGLEAKVYDHPENCYPAEPGEIEIIEAQAAGCPVAFTDQDRERIEEEILMTLPDLRQEAGNGG